MSDFVSGAAGVVVGAFLSSAAWVFAARGEVRLHDAQAQELSTNLSTWARNRAIQLGHDRKEVVNRANASGALSSGARINAERGLMARAGDEMNDQSFRAMERWSNIKAAEDFRHRFWRSRLLRGHKLKYPGTFDDMWIVRLRAHETTLVDAARLAFDDPVQ